jgi:osmoprotectant transport system permease protein
VNRRLVATDPIAVTGSIIGLAALFMDWLITKPNRLVEGAGLSIIDVLGWYGAVVLGSLWIICLFISLLGKGRHQGMLIGVLANIVLIIAVFAVLGLASQRLISEDMPLARVSIGPGIWVSFAAAYLAIFAARLKLKSDVVLRNLITWIGPVVFLVLLFTGWFDSLSIMQEFAGREGRFMQELRHHMMLVVGSVVSGTLLGILLGIWATWNKTVERPIFFITNITQAIPSLALFGLLIAPLSALSFAFPILREVGIRGIGDAPALIALTIYSLLPIVQNTYAGLRQVDPAATDAGLGMGMTRLQVFSKMQAPLAAPIVLDGVRTAAVQSVGLTAVAALIGAGGLGWFIFQGLGQAADDLILLGAIPIIVMALAVDSIMRIIVVLATPKGLLREKQ